MQSAKSNVTWQLVLLAILCRPLICQMCYPSIDIYYCSIFLACTLIWVVFTPRISLKNHLNLPIILFVIAASSSTFFSVNMHASIKAVYKFVPFLVIFYLAAEASARQKRQILFGLVAVALLISLFAIYQFFWGFQYILDYIKQTKPYPFAQEFLGRRRVFATFFSPDMFAGYLIVILPLATGLFLENLSRKNRTLYFLSGTAIFFISISLLLTRSIGAWMSLFVAFLTFASLLFLHFPQLRRKIVISSSIVCIVIASVLSVMLIIRSEYLFNLRHPYNSIMQRFLFWKSAINMIKNFPITGVGLGNFGLLHHQYKDPQTIEAFFTHNSYLQVWAEMGILGLSAWLWVALKSLNIGLSRLKTANTQKFFIISLIAASVSFLVHNFIDFDFFVPEVAFHWWLLLGLLKD